MTRNVRQLTRYFLRTQYQAYRASAFFSALGNFGTIKYMPGEFLKYFFISSYFAIFAQFNSNQNIYYNW